jgi:hypothetical protein
LRLILFVLVDQLVLAKLDKLLLVCLHHIKDSFLLALDIKTNVFRIILAIEPLAKPFKLPINVYSSFNDPFHVKIIEEASPFGLAGQLESKIELSIWRGMLAMPGNRGD